MTKNEKYNFIVSADQNGHEVLNNFEDPQEIYSIIERNLTAGVAYKLQDTDGVDWGKS